MAELLDLTVLLHTEVTLGWLRVVGAPLDYAAGLAGRIGEGKAWWMGFGPANVGCWRIHMALEAGDYQRAIAIAEGLHPDALRVPKYRAYSWANYGRALARVRNRLNDAALAFRPAERISPHHLGQDSAARETLAELVARSKQDAVGRELRAMAWRAGLPVELTVIAETGPIPPARLPRRYSPVR